MNRRVFTHRRVLTGVVVLLVVMSQLPGPAARWMSNKPRHIVASLLNPVTQPLWQLSSSVRRPVDLDVDLPILKLTPLLPPDIAQQLRQTQLQDMQYMRQLEMELDEARRTIAQLRQIKQHLKLEDARFADAAVTMASVDPTVSTLTINRGTRDHMGLRIGLVVAAGFDLVGRLSNVGPASSTARVITGPRTLLTVRIVAPVSGPPNRQVFPVQLQSDPATGLFYAQVDGDAPIQLEDIAHLDDRNWPSESRGLIVGKVIKVEPHPDDPVLRRRVIVQPIRSLRHLTRVLVLVPGNGEE